MYETFYGLKTKPFSILPDPEFLYLGKKHRVALTMLEYALMNNAGFCVISGEIGAGKTTLLRKLLASIEENSTEDITIGMITNTHQSFGELLDWVLSAFGIHQPGLGKVEMHQRLVDFLLEQYAKNKTTLLIVDEAQNMPAATLEELRMLSNINSEKDLVLQVILAGQPELKDLLRKPELTQFAQRISVDFHLAALNSIETCHYIQHRLVTAGATDDIFTPEACRLIYGYSGGVPRLINLLCDTALVYGFADQQKTIGVDLVQEMIDERMEHSILPMTNINKKDHRNDTENDDFPWINPDGGTAGLKPAAEKKTLEKAAFRIEQANEGVAQAVGLSPQTDESTTNAAKTIAAVAENSASKKIAPVVEMPAGAYFTEWSSRLSQYIKPFVEIPAESYIVDNGSNDSIENDGQASSHDGISETSGGRAHNQAVDTIIAPIDDQAEKSQFGNRIIIFALFMLALLLSLTTATSDYGSMLSGTAKDTVVVVELKNDPADVEFTNDPVEIEIKNDPTEIEFKNDLAEFEFKENQTEIETMKQDLARVQRQAEDMQRERDAALANLRAEEERRAQAAQAALEAESREKQAAAAATSVVEEAQKAAEQTERLVKQQRFEMRTLVEEREKLKQSRQQIELQQRRADEQRKMITQEWARIAREKKAWVEKRVLQEWGDDEMQDEAESTE